MSTPISGVESPNELTFQEFVGMVNHRSLFCSSVKRVLDAHVEWVFSSPDGSPVIIILLK